MDDLKAASNRAAGSNVLLLTATPWRPKRCQQLHSAEWRKSVWRSQMKHSKVGGAKLLLMEPNYTEQTVSRWADRYRRPRHGVKEFFCAANERVPGGHRNVWKLTESRSHKSSECLGAQINVFDS
jgi:hypothetical protein